MYIKSLAVLPLTFHRSLTESSLQVALDGFSGSDRVDCSKVCSALGQPYERWKSEVVADIAKFTCTCGEEDTTIECIGQPFLRCCKDGCAESSCPTTPQGWQCPLKGGCADDVCHGAHWQEWVAVHNVFRCMHDVPSVSWKDEVYVGGWNHFQYKKEMVHSDSFDEKPPYGPAGENLFIEYDPLLNCNPMDIAGAWYSEIVSCGSFNGCRVGNTGVIDHFTTLIWQGGKTIGCFKNGVGLGGCRYKAHDFRSCHTPNFGFKEDWTHNVYPRKRSFQECKQEVARCGLPFPEPTCIGTLDSISGLITNAKLNITKEYLVLPHSRQVDEVLRGHSRYSVPIAALGASVGVILLAMKVLQCRRIHTVKRSKSGIPPELGDASPLAYNSEEIEEMFEGEAERTFWA